MPPFRPAKKATPEQALQQVKHFCGFRERCHEEVREKLRSLGVWRSDQEEILSKLIETDYLNEERFARVFAGGKFRVNKWGRNRIRYALKQKKVSDYCIRKGLEEIDEADYLKVLARLAADKYKSLSDSDALRRKKTQEYLMGRGFEFELIKSALSSVS